MSAWCVSPQAHLQNQPVRSPRPLASAPRSRTHAHSRRSTKTLRLTPSSVTRAHACAASVRLMSIAPPLGPPCIAGRRDNAFCSLSEWPLGGGGAADCCRGQGRCRHQGRAHAAIPPPPSIPTIHPLLLQGLGRALRHGSSCRDSHLSLVVSPSTANTPARSDPLHFNAAKGPRGGGGLAGGGQTSLSLSPPP
jgi:hypothetical protein